MSISGNESYMREAISLALNGRECSPNPRVGCVIVRDGKIIGRGWHKKCGCAHAEVEAVRNAGGDVEGSDVYVTLEPCSHYGKTPPCADMLIEHKVKKVIAGIGDPNPKIAGRGFEKLRNAGIEVECGVLAEECKWVNRGFLMRIMHNRPWITIKTAASLDGKIALSNGESKWITCAASRAKVHEMRAASDCIVTGVGTIIADDPLLTVRDAPGQTPLRVILDRSLRTPVDAKIFSTAEQGNILIFTSEENKGKIHTYEKCGASVKTVCRDSFLRSVFAELGAAGVNYAMVEAGSRVTSAVMRERLCDELALFAAPKIMGRGMSFADGLEFASMSDVPELKSVQVSTVESDILVRGVFKCSPDL